MVEQNVADDKRAASETITSDSNHEVEKGGDTKAVVDNSLFPIYNVFEQRSHQIRNAWLFLLATVVLCAVTVSFAYSALISDSKVPRYYNFSPTKTIRMLNIASVLTILLVKSLIGAVLDAFCCALAYAPGGTSVSSFRATQKTTELPDLGKLLLIFGKHQIWSIMRLVIFGLTVVASILLMSEISSKDVYDKNNEFPVLAGLADLHDAVQKLESVNVFANTSTSQETEINMLILGTTRSILTDPTIAIPIAPIQCQGADCVSVFLPGGLGLVRNHDGSALNTTAVPSADGAIIVNNAPGYQMEYGSTNYTFNNATDCHQYGLPVSGVYSCIKYDNGTIYAGMSICPFNLMKTADCQSNKSWTTTLDASLALSLYQRIATTAYDKSNFSILSLDYLGPPTDATHPNITADFQLMFSVMYPGLANLVSDIEAAILKSSSIYPELGYWASVYCVQSELSSANYLYETGFPNWVTGERDILAGFLAIPIQFGTLLLQWLHIEDNTGPLSTTASGATAVYRARMEPWTLWLFTAIVFGIVLWALACLAYVHLTALKPEELKPSPNLEAAFKTRNPFVITDKGLLGVLGAVFACFCFRPAKAHDFRGGDEERVTVRAPNEETLVVMKHSGP